MSRNGAIPVLEIGGTHVTAALVDPNGSGVLPGRSYRASLTPMGTAEEIIAELARVARQIDPPARATWGVAIPGPFDYERGIALFRGVGKFDTLYGIDLRRSLLDAIQPEAIDVRFLNDADAFAIGEWSAGSARGYDRIMAITLGTGVGSSFLDRGRPIHGGSDVPPDGSAHRLEIDGKPLEETVSRRAILDRYRALGGDRLVDTDVRELAQLARQGDPIATSAISGSMEALGRALAPWVSRFQPGIIVVGGGMTRAWDVMGTPFSLGLNSESHGQAVAVTVADDGLDAALIGAALHASRTMDGIAEQTRSEVNG